MNRIQHSIVAVLLSMAATGAALAADNPGPPTGAAAGTAPAAGTTTTSQAIAKRPPVNSDDQIVCKREDEIGSRLGGNKVCMTRRDWRRQSADAGDEVSRAQSPH